MGANRGKGPDKQAKGRRNSFGSDENPNVDEEVGPGSENKVAVSATSMGGRISHNMGQQPLRQAMMTNASTASEIKFEFGGMPSGAGSAAQDFQSSNFGTNFSENPYDFENFQNKEVFATQIQQNQNFDGFNFDMPQPNAGAQEKRKAPPAANDFGFDFGAPDPGAKPIKS